PLSGRPTADARRWAVTTQVTAGRPGSSAAMAGSAGRTAVWPRAAGSSAASSTGKGARTGWGPGGGGGWSGGAAGAGSGGSAGASPGSPDGVRRRETTRTGEHESAPKWIRVDALSLLHVGCEVGEDRVVDPPEPLGCEGALEEAADAAGALPGGGDDDPGAVL